MAWGEYALLVLVAYVAYEFGFGIVGGRRVQDGVYLPSHESQRSAVLASSGLVGLGLLGYVLFAYTYGFDVVTTTNIRYKANQIELSRIGSFFLYTRIWILVGFLIWLAQYLVSAGARSVSRAWLVVLYALVSYTAVQGASRGYFLYLILLPLVCYLVAVRRVPILLVTCFLLGLPVLIVFGRTVLAYDLLSDPIGSFTRLGTVLYSVQLTKMLSEMVASFSHPFASVPVAIQFAEIQGYRYYYDIPLGILFYLKLVGMDFGLSISYIHTYNLSADFNSNVPPGIIAAGYYQQGVVGVVGCLGLFGGMSRVIQDLILRLVTRNSAYLAIYVYLGVVLANFVMNGDPRVYAIRISLLVFAMGVIMVCDRVYGVRRVGVFVS